MVWQMADLQTLINNPVFLTAQMGLLELNNDIQFN